MKKALLLLFFLLPASLTLMSCGGGGSAPGPHTSGLTNRAFVSNLAAGSVPGAVYIVNASDDVRPNVAPISAGVNPGMMVVTPNLSQTLVFSGNDLPTSDNQFTIINNAAETAAGHVILPGMTQSFVVSPDSSTAYVAVPTAPVLNQSPGMVAVIALASQGVVATISCPPGNPTPVVCTSTDPNLQGINVAFNYLSIGNTGNRLLAFNQGSGRNFDSVANVVEVITPSNIQTGNPVVTLVPGFDHPIWAYFNSNDSIAYVLNCGPECGGTQASIQTLDLTTNTAGTAVPVPAATVALVVNSSTMYLAGTPYLNGAPSQLCAPAQTTAAVTCGVLTIFDLNTMSVVQPPVLPPYSCAVSPCPIVITDGYHTQLSLGQNGQLYIGASNCTEIIPPQPPPTGAEIRGCLSIYNTLPAITVGSNPPGGVLIPPQNGDVTGIQPITNRGDNVAQEVVYVIQGQGTPVGGTLYIYDDTIDALEYNPNDSNNPGKVNGLVGSFFDVVTVDY